MNESRKRRWKWLVVSVAIGADGAAALIYFRGQLAIDSCLDLGGRWDAKLVFATNLKEVFGSMVARRLQVTLWLSVLSSLREESKRIAFGIQAV